MLAEPAYAGTNTITPLKKPVGEEPSEHHNAYSKENNLGSTIVRAMAQLKN